MTDPKAEPCAATRLILAFAAGDRAALDEMVPLVYDELHRLAAHYLGAERANHTLQPTALVHEAYLRLVNQRQVDWRNRPLDLPHSCIRRGPHARPRPPRRVSGPGLRRRP